jgi:hypothetical protein
MERISLGDAPEFVAESPSGLPGRRTLFCPLRMLGSAPFGYLIDE